MSERIKRCRRCGLEKPAEEYYRNSTTTAGLHSWCKTCCLANQRERQASGIRRRVDRRSTLRRVYGLELEDYELLLELQEGLCAICRRPPGGIGPGTGELLHVDHDHETGEVRGLLCHECNRGLGCFKDDVARIAAAAAYLSTARTMRIPRVQEALFDAHS